MVTGRKAFDGDSPASVIAAIMQHDPPSITAVQPSAPPALEHVVSTCLAKDPDERWQNAGDLTRELKWIAAVGRLRADPQEPATRPNGPARLDGGRRPVSAVTLALAALSIPAAVGDRRRRCIGRRSCCPRGCGFREPGPVGGIGRFALSPDGRRMAFVATDPNGNQMLWMRPLDSLAAAAARRHRRRLVAVLVARFAR